MTNKKLSTQLRSERVAVQTKPGRLVLQSRGSRIVQLANGSFASQEIEPIAIETEGDLRGSMNSRLLDPSIPEEAKIIDMVKEYIAENPTRANDYDIQLRIVGEHRAEEPWIGYEEQTAEQVLTQWESMSPRAQEAINLEQAMKYELDRCDPETGESWTNEDKVKALDKLYREQMKLKSVEKNTGVSI